MGETLRARVRPLGEACNFFLTEIIVIVFVNVDSLCDRISLVRLVSLGYSALNPLYVASFAGPSSSVSYPGARK